MVARNEVSSLPNVSVLALRLVRYLSNFPFIGLIGAVLFFALSLAPSLIPRDPLIQGGLSAISSVVGYCFGVTLLWLWTFLELPVPKIRWIMVLAGAGTIAFAGYALWLSAERQATLREFLSLEQPEATYAPIVFAIALAAAIVLREIGRLFGWIARSIARVLDRKLPRRVSLLLGVVVAALALSSVVSGTVGRFALQSLDAMFLALDELIDDDMVPPSHDMASGGENSLISWSDLGRQGRHFVTSGPTRQDVAQFTGETSEQPIRVYVGLSAAETPDERAKLALEELKRVGAFRRSVLVIATPTGTGWIDEEAVDPLEFLHGGDTAIVALQYSYLTSYVSLFIEPGYATTSARALFDEVYGHWRSLPAGSRPRLYLHGLSLGSAGSEQSMTLHAMLGDLIHGAVWSGPPFSNPSWSEFTRDRNPGTPYWLPKVGDGSYVRFTNQTNALDIPGASWGPVRLVYLQYASDPITFFSPDLFWREPDWLKNERGPDVSPNLEWFPVVTALQVAFDMVGASALGTGLGHLYAASDYIDAWIAVTEPKGWSRAEIERLKRHFGD